MANTNHQDYGKPLLLEIDFNSPIDNLCRVSCLASSAAQISNRHPLVLFDLIGAYATLAHNEGAQEIMEEAMANTNALPARINDYYFQPA